MKLAAVAASLAAAAFLGSGAGSKLNVDGNLTAVHAAESAACECDMPGTAPGAGLFARVRSFMLHALHRRPLCYEPAQEPITDSSFGWKGDPSGCHTGYYSTVTQKLQKCLPHDPEPAIYLVGDSHAWALQQAFKKAAGNMKVYHASWQKLNDHRQPTDVFKKALTSVVKNNDIIVFAHTSKGTYDEHARQLKAVVDVREGAKLLLIGDFPAPLPTDPGACFQHSQASNTLGQPTSGPFSCQMTKSAAEASRSAMATFAKSMAKGHPTKVFFFDAAGPLCPDGKCDLWVPGTSEPAYLDNFHLNAAGSSYLSSSLCNFFSANNFGGTGMH